MDTMAMSTKNYPAIPFKEDDRTLRAFEFYGGCPELIIPDNLRSGINPVRRSAKTPINTEFIGVLGCRCTPI